MLSWIPEKSSCTITQEPKHEKIPDLHCLKEETISYKSRLVDRRRLVISTETDPCLETSKQPLADGRVHLSHLFPDPPLEKVEGCSLPAFLIDSCLQKTPKILYWADLWWIWRVCRLWDEWNFELIKQVSCLFGIMATGKVRPEVEVIVTMILLQKRDKVVFDAFFTVQFACDWDFSGDKERFWDPSWWNAYPYHQLIWVLARGHEANIFWHLRHRSIPWAIVPLIPRGLVTLQVEVALVIHYDFSCFGCWKKTAAQLAACMSSPLLLTWCVVWGTFSFPVVDTSLLEHLVDTDMRTPKFFAQFSGCCSYLVLCCLHQSLLLLWWQFWWLGTRSRPPLHWDILLPPCNGVVDGAFGDSHGFEVLNCEVFSASPMLVEEAASEPALLLPFEMLHIGLGWVSWSSDQLLGF